MVMASGLQWASVTYPPPKAETPVAAGIQELSLQVRFWAKTPIPLIKQSSGPCLSLPINQVIEPKTSQNFFLPILKHIVFSLWDKDSENEKTETILHFPVSEGL